MFAPQESDSDFLNDLQKLSEDTLPQESSSNPEPKKLAKAKFKMESLEDRVLYSATWADLDAEAIDGPSGEDDIFIGTDRRDVANAGAGNDLLDGLEGNDVLNGGAGDDYINGGQGNDVLRGGAGNDTFDYDEDDGRDRFIGGSGNDTIDATDAKTLNLNRLTRSDSIETIDGAEAGTQIEGTERRDNLDFSKTQLNNISEIDTGAGNDNVRGSQGDDVIDGGTGNDVLRGNGGDDTFNYDQGDGQDRFHGGSGNDTIDATDAETINMSRMSARDSIETIDGSEAGTQIEGTERRDNLDFSKTQLNNISEIDTGAGNDNVHGSQGDDVIDGGTGNDVLRGNGGDDTFNYDQGDGQDRFIGGSGNDTIDATDAETLNMSRMSTRDSIEMIDGSESGTQIEGSDRRDNLDFSKTQLNNISEIDTGAGKDNVRGSQGDDVIVGGTGNDVLQGNGGDDTFVYNEGDGTDRFQGGSGNDTIDATNAETLNLNRISTRDSIESIVGADEGTRIEGSEGRNVLDFSKTELNNISEIDAGAGNDVVRGSQGDDVFIAGEGNDRFEGNGGNDVVRFEGNRSDYEITELRNGSFAVQDLRDGSPDGRDIVSNVEVLQFSDGQVQIGEGVEFTPDSLQISISPVPENAEAGTVVATLGEERTPPDEVSYEIIDNIGNVVDDPNFEVVNNEIVVKDGADLNFHQAADHQLQIRATDAGGEQYSAPVTIEITNVNDAPTTTAMAFSVPEDGVLSGNLLSNASDADGDQLGVKIVSQPENGSAVVDDKGEFVYEPNTNFSGTDSFTFEVSDGNGGVVSEQVTIDVTSVNDAPTISAMTFSTSEDGSLEGNLLATASDVDGDALVVSKFTQPDNGSVAVDGNGDFVYEPSPNFNGTDSFSIEVSDGNGEAVTEQVTIEVTSINDAPTTQRLSFDIAEDGFLEGNLLTIASDVDGDQLVVAGVSQPENGTVIFDQSGDFVYEPNENFSGTDEFLFDVSDGSGQLVSEQVTIEVAPSADGVEMEVSHASGQETSGIPLNIDANLIDVDGSESISKIVISGVPLGAELSAGTEMENGTWELTERELRSLEIKLDGFANEDFELTVEITSQDGNDESIQTKTVSVDVKNGGLAEASVLNLQDGISADGSENESNGDVSEFGDALANPSEIEDGQAFGVQRDAFAFSAREASDPGVDTDIWNNARWNQMSDDFAELSVRQNADADAEETLEEVQDLADNLAYFFNPDQLIADDPTAYETAALKTQSMDVDDWEELVDDDESVDTSRLTAASLLMLFTTREDKRRKLKDRKGSAE